MGRRIIRPVSCWGRKAAATSSTPASSSWSDPRLPNKIRGTLAYASVPLWLLYLYFPSLAAKFSPLPHTYMYRKNETANRALGSSSIHRTYRSTQYLVNKSPKI